MKCEVIVYCGRSRAKQKRQTWLRRQAVVANGDRLLMCKSSVDSASGGFISVRL